MGLVGLMSMIFLTTMCMSNPDWSEVLRGFILPSIPAGEWLLVVGLVGTTVVPYNLFLHASVVQEHYAGPEELPDLRRENATAIILGGVISISIVITSAANVQGTGIRSVMDMAQALEPLLGAWAPYVLGIGLFAAGISSAITAPLAAAYAVKGIMGWPNGLQDRRLRAVWISVLGILSAMSGFSPIGSFNLRSSQRSTASFISRRTLVVNQLRTNYVGLCKLAVDSSAWRWSGVSNF